MAKGQCVMLKVETDRALAFQGSAFSDRSVAHTLRDLWTFCWLHSRFIRIELPSNKKPKVRANECRQALAWFSSRLR